MEMNCEVKVHKCQAKVELSLDGPTQYTLVTLTKEQALRLAKELEEATK